ncbi:MAG: hypothetical protein ACNS62_13075 [Candidatus Cyclobacteriaceae bacterium M3_2C_046]
MKKFLILILLAFSSQCLAQSPFQQLYAGAYFTGDAEMYYLGPSFLVGADILLMAPGLILSPYGQYFSVNYTNESYDAAVLAVLLQFDFNPKKSNALFMGFGPSFSFRREIYHNIEESNRFLIPAIRVGYRFLFKNLNVNAEITTPAFYRQNLSFELFTLPSVGIRIGGFSR